jgi:hypothetical protein
MAVKNFLPIAAFKVQLGHHMSNSTHALNVGDHTDTF